jgi:hypothetical protein
MKIKYFYLLLLTNCTALLHCYDFTGKTEECAPVIKTKFDVLLSQIHDLEKSAAIKKQNLQTLFRPVDFVKRKQIRTIIKLQKSAIENNINTAVAEGDISSKEYFVLNTHLSNI